MEGKMKRVTLGLVLATATLCFAGVVAHAGTIYVTANDENNVGIQNVHVFVIQSRKDGQVITRDDYTNERGGCQFDISTLTTSDTFLVAGVYGNNSQSTPVPTNSLIDGGVYNVYFTFQQAPQQRQVNDTPLP